MRVPASIEGIVAQEKPRLLIEIQPGPGRGAFATLLPEDTLVTQRKFRDCDRAARCRGPFPDGEGPLRWERTLRSIL